MRAVVACVLFLSAARASASPCRKIDGEDALLTRGRVVLVGEIHGTNEMPALFVELVCRAVERGLDVDVGFEQHEAAAVQRFWTTGSAADRYAIVGPKVKWGDGTSSVAMVDAYAALRALGPKVHPFVFGNRGPRYEDVIAATHRKDRVMLALMGNAHAALLRDPDDDADPVGLALRKRGLDVKSIWIDFTRGGAYNLGIDGSRVHEQVGTAGSMKPYALQPSKDPHYDHAISIGEMHPSPPAKP